MSKVFRLPQLGLVFTSDIRISINIRTYASAVGTSWFANPFVLVKSIKFGLPWSAYCACVCQHVCAYVTSDIQALEWTTTSISTHNVIPSWFTPLYCLNEIFKAANSFPNNGAQHGRNLVRLELNTITWGKTATIKKAIFSIPKLLNFNIAAWEAGPPRGGGGATGTVCSGPQPKEGPQAPSAGGTLGISSREAPFGSLSVLINLFPLCFKWKSNNWIRLSNFIESTLFIYSLNTEPGQDTHIFTRIVIFRLSGKEPDESAIVKCNIDQNKIL